MAPLRTPKMEQDWTLLLMAFGVADTTAPFLMFALMLLPTDTLIVIESMNLRKSAGKSNELER